jgi:hypothetical protein
VNHWLPKIILAFNLATLLAIGGCKTSERSSEANLKSTALPVARAQPIYRACPPEKECGERVDPSFCQLESYDGQKLEESERLYSWRHNSCEGELAILRTACFMGRDPEKLGRINCVPDSSQDSCPFKPTTCSKEFRQATCVSQQYNGQDLNSSQQLSADGTNECEAMNRLKLAACKRNLNPEYLAGITCRDHEKFPKSREPADVRKSPL